ASFSSTMKLKLMLDAPCETMRMLMSDRLPNARRATPGVYFRSLPTRHMSAALDMTCTSPSCRRSSTIAWRDETLSRVNETETSEVATISTEVRWRSKTSNSALRNPCAISIRDEETVKTVIPLFTAIDLIRLLH